MDNVFGASHPKDWHLGLYYSFLYCMSNSFRKWVFYTSCSNFSGPDYRFKLQYLHADQSRASHRSRYTSYPLGYSHHLMLLPARKKNVKIKHVLQRREPTQFAKPTARLVWNLQSLLKLVDLVRAPVPKPFSLSVHNLIGRRSSKLAEMFFLARSTSRPGTFLSASRVQFIRLLQSNYTRSTYYIIHPQTSRVTQGAFKWSVSFVIKLVFDWYANDWYNGHLTIPSSHPRNTTAHWESRR